MARDAAPLSVVLIFDAGYLMPAQVTLHSLLKYASVDLRVYVVMRELDAEKCRLSFERIAENARAKFKRSCEFKWTFADGAIEAIRAFPENNDRKELTSSAYLKFWIPSLVPEKECVYLDVDAIVLSDVAECKAHAPKLPCTISAVLNRQTVREMDGNFRKLHEYYALPSGLYFNTGLMVMNLEALRRSRWTEKCCEVVHAHPTLMVHKDQDAINAVHNHLTQSMPARFNYHDFSTNGYQLGSPFYQAALRLGLCYASLTAGENVVELAEKMYDAALPSNVFLLHYSSAPKPWVPKGYLCRQHSWHWFAMAREALPAAEFSAFFSCAKLRAAFLWRRAYFNAGRDRALVKGVRRLAWGSAPLFGV